MFHNIIYTRECTCTDRKKVVEVTLLPTDIEVLENIRVPSNKRDLGYFVRKFQQIKVRIVNQLCTVYLLSAPKYSYCYI